MSSRALSCLVPAAAVLWLIVLLAPRHFAKAFWYDEVWVLQQAREPSAAAAIAAARERGSPIPMGYLVGLHVLAPLAEGRAWVWRLPSMGAAVLLAGVLGYVLLRATNSPLAAVLGALLPFAGPHTFQRYAFEVKPYMLEGAVTGLFVCLVPSMAASGARAAYTWCLLALLAVTCLFSSQFAAAASWIVATAWLVRAGQWAAARRLFVCGVVVTVAWGAMYVEYVGPVSHGAKLRAYWQNSYLVADAGLPDQLRLLARRWIDACWAAYPSVPRALIAVVLATGLLAWLVADPMVGLAAGVTIAIALAVSALGHWPLESRMNLPSLALLHVGPTVLAWRVPRMLALRWPPVSFVPARAIAVAVAVSAIAGPVVIASEAKHVPADGQDVMAALEFTAGHAQQDDVLLLDQVSGTNVDAGVVALAGRRVDGPRVWDSPDTVLAAASRVPSSHRAWLPVTHALPRVAGLDGRTTADGRVFRLAWSGRGTAVFVADGSPAGAPR